jgi:hypothetical protein
MLLNYSSDVKQHQLSAKLVHMDTPSEFEKCTDANLGYKARKDYFATSKIVDTIGHLHSDIFNQDRYMLT